MKSKLMIAVTSALLVVFAGAGADNGNRSDARKAQPQTVGKAAPRFDRSMLRAAPAAVNKAGAKQTAHFKAEKGLRGEHLYIVRLEDEPVPTYRGGIKGLAATSIDNAAKAPAAANRNARGVLDAASPASVAYANFLDSRHQGFKQKLDQNIGRASVQAYSYKFSLNGIALRLTQEEAAIAARTPGVVSVTRDRLDKIDTDRGPTFLGAPGVWDGSGTEMAGHMGEGMLVGILDTGINYSSLSFAEVGADGYVHTNPLGDGVFLGECDDFAGLCNNKLIGGYSFLEASNGDPLTPPGDPLSKDTDGHGSHVGSTSAGNFVEDPPFLDIFGNETGVTLGDISGVAPHANLIAYKVCAPSCGAADRVAAMDMAIQNGVNAVNHSIGSGAGSPWLEPVAVAFKNGRAAGIMVHNSAGNSGPGPGTAEAGGNGPWVTGVAASTHDRFIPPKFLNEYSGGDGAPPADITGRSFSGGYTGPIVWAGDFSNGDPDPQQCLTPFSPGTWAGEIVLCERGAIARVEKCINVQAGGASGCVLMNTQGGADTLVNDPHIVPAIHISADDGDTLKAWLASGSGHVATITPSDTPVVSLEEADWLAGFSSRGPYTGFDFLAPSVSAPGVDIFAAGADLARGVDNPNASVGGPYGMISGTSMSSPHATGSSTLVKAVRPEWTAAEVLSAVMTTGKTSMFKEDGVIEADPFDYGGGRVQIQEAIRAGLLLDESVASFDAADPNLGGDPRALNVPYFYDSNCLQVCSWERTVKATRAGTWTASTTARDPDLAITVEPASFTLGEGQVQTVSVSANASALPLEQWAFGEVVFTPDQNGGLETPPTTMQLIVSATSGIRPDEINIDAGRNAGSEVTGGFRGIEVTDLQAQAFGPTKGEETTVTIRGEFAQFDPYQGIATATTFYDIPNNTARFVVKTRSDEAPDVDLFVGRDDNGDGEISADEERCNSGTATASEFCELFDLEAGSWWVTVLQFTASSPDASNDTVVTAAVVSPSIGGLGVEGPNTVPPGEEYAVRVSWDAEMKEGDEYYAAIRLGTDADSPDNIGTIPVNIERIEDDVRITASSDTAVPGDTLTFTVEVAPNFTPEDREYDISTAIPEGFTLVPGSVTGGGSDNGGAISWNVLQESLASIERLYTMTTSDDDPLCDTGFDGYVNLEELGIFPDGGISGDTATWTAFTGQNINFYGEQKTGMNFTDDGFAFFASTPGTEPWVNQPIPSAAEPNDLAAMFWSDWEIVYDAATNRGVTLAVAGADLSVIEYDDAEPWPAGDTDTHYDFQLVITGFVDDAPGAYEVVLAYDNMVNARFDHGVTAGVENLTGTAGTSFGYNDSEAFTDGLMVCFDFAGPSVDPATLSYQVTVDASASGDVVTTLTNSVDNPGSEEVAVDLSVFVESAVDSDDDGVTDALDNCTLVANADQRDTNGDGFGNICDGDFNQDGVVNWTDLGYMRIEFLTDDADADLNGDGMVNAGDLGIMKDLFYAPPGPSGLSGG